MEFFSFNHSLIKKLSTDSSSSIFFQYVHIIEEYMVSLLDDRTESQDFHQVRIHSDEPDASRLRVELPTAHFMGVISEGKELPHPLKEIPSVIPVCYKSNFHCSICSILSCIFLLYPKPYFLNTKSRLIMASHSV